MWPVTLMDMTLKMINGKMLNTVGMTTWHGHLEMAKWLVSLNAGVDVRAQNDDAFQKSCGNQCVEVAKWLMSLDAGVEVRVKNDDAFRQECGNQCVEVAKWLMSFHK